MPPPDSHRLSPPWSLRVLLAASMLLPFLATGLFVWHDYQRSLAAASQRVDRIAAIATEHTLKVVDTNALVLDRMGELLHGLSWEELREQRERIHQGLRSLDQRVNQLRVLHIVEPNGDLLAISIAWPTPRVNLSNRDYFRHHAEGFNGLYFGEPLVGRTSGELAFTMSRPRLSEDGRFDGVYLGSVPPAYFEQQWQTMVGTGERYIALLRDDGTVLAQLQPATPPAVLPGVQSLLQLARAGGTEPSWVSDANRQEWLATTRRVGQEQILVTFALPRSEILAGWRRTTAIVMAVAAAITFALSFVTWLACNRWVAAQAAIQSLAGTASELREQIEKRERAEEQLAQAQRLEAMGRLTGGIAHDFNNLLTAILGTVQMLERHLGSQADDRAKRLMAMARDAVARGARLNSSLLSFARRQPLKREALDANALVTGFEPLIQRALGEAVTLRLSLAPGLPQCQADAAQLEAALLNLAINARDALPEGGEVEISTRTAWLSRADLVNNEEAHPGPFTEIRMTDSGSGMEPEVLARAFEPFFTTKAPGRGTGLGLSQVFGFVRQLGGHVAIRSEPGRGTGVSLYLPLTPGTGSRVPEPQQQRQAAVVAMASATVLVAEDDTQVREMVAEMLRDAGFRVLAAADGRQALELLENGQQVDVLFSDVVMPSGISGMDLARRALELHPEIGVLLASGYTGPVLGKEVPEFDILAKPYQREVLVRRIAGLAQRARPTVA
jgi:two-component system NtrC family sensor kinase